MMMYGSMANVKKAKVKSEPRLDRRAYAAANPYSPLTMLTAVKAFFVAGPHSYQHRVLAGLPVVLGACVAYAFWFGIYLMGWSPLTTACAAGAAPRYRTTADSADFCTRRLVSSLDARRGKTCCIVSM